MRVCVPRESAPGEHRVALTPDAATKLRASGFDVVVERGAGVRAGFTDDQYTDAGITLVDHGQLLDGADAIVRVGKPTGEDLESLPSGVVLIGFLEPLTDTEGIARLRERGVVAFAMESIPRITRAQSMDALSSQATVAGYKAVLLAADRSPKLFPMLMTAAGTIAPARVLVLGAGVAGLQAIATARRLGAVVSAFDVRPTVAEQVESLGASFLDLGVRGEETEGGYAQELTAEQRQAQQAALEERLSGFDVVITTAAVPGRPAPKLIPAEAVESMRPGSVIVDLASESGGNCELTEPGREITHTGVTIVGLTNVASSMPSDASRLYARNVTALLDHLAPGGTLELDFEDEITAGACVTGPPPATAGVPDEGQIVTRVRRSVREGSDARDRHQPRHRADHPGALHLPRLRGDLEGSDDAAHAPHVGHELHPRDRRRRCDHRPRVRRRRVHEDRRLRRDGAGVRERGGRLVRDRPDARDVQAAPGRPSRAGA